MEKIDKKRQNRIVMACAAAGICLAGSAAAVFAAGRNPLTKGLMNLEEEAASLEEEMGKYFWTDAVNRIGSESVQAEYSVNAGGIPELQNITVGLDGRVRRDMESRLLDAEVDLSVANAEIAEASLFGTTDAIYLQVPSVWEGSVVFDAENISGQWNESTVRKELQQLAGRELGIGRRVDAELFHSFSTESYSIIDFLEENGGALKALYKNMEVTRLEKAQREGLLGKKEAETLGECILRDADGERIETVCYLVVLPEKELKEIFADLTGDVRLGVYLDSGKRIVRVCTLPGETLATVIGEGEFAVDLTGEEATLDRFKLYYSISRDGAGGQRSVSEPDDADETKSDVQEAADLSVMLSLLPDITGIEGNAVIEKEGAGSYKIECESTLTEREHVWEFSLEGNIQGQRSEAGEKISLEAENFVLRSQDKVICRANGRAVFAPLTEKIEMPAGEEYRVGKMNELETALFLAECAKNVYRNFSGYLKMME